MTDPYVTLRFNGSMSRARRTTERQAVAALLECGFTRIGPPTLRISRKQGYEEFEFTYTNTRGNTATLKTRHPVDTDY